MPIDKLSDVTCVVCEVAAICESRRKNNIAWQTVMDTVWRNSIPKQLCGNYIAITAPQMIDGTEDDEA